MHPNYSRPRPLVWGLVLAAGLAGTLAYAQQAPPGQPKKDDVLPVKIDPKTGAVIVPLGGTARFVQKDVDLALKQETPKEPPTDVQVEKEGVLVFRPDPNVPGALLLTGRSSGATKLTFFYKDSPARSYLIVAEADLDLLRLQIRKTVPTATVDVSAGIQTQSGQVIILSGYVTSPQDSDTILKLASGFAGGTTQNIINAIQVGGVQQVQIDVVVASVDRNEIRARGFDFFVNSPSFQFNSIVSGLIGPQTIGSGQPITLTPSPDANLQFAVVPTQFFGALRALRTEGLAKFLAEPRVVTQTGRPAFFLAGGRQAVLGPASGINGPGVTFEQIGTQLEVLPIVYGNGQIWLEINPQVRAVNQGLGITTVFGATPGFTEQQARCAVMLESGQTFAIGGLIQNSVQASSAKIPVLGDLPYIGVAFSNIRHEERESESVILVTPRLVHPLDCRQLPKRLPGRETRSPDDYELFLENVLEAPRGQRKVWTGKQYNAPYKCDPTLGTYPCIGNLCTGPNLGGYGNNCGPNGCATPSGPMMQAMPGRTADPMGQPATLPATVPQTIPSGPVGMADPTASTLPVSQPVVVPERPRN